MPKPKEKTITIKVLEHSVLNENLLEELDLLFDLVPPCVLHKSINDIFWAYLCNTEQEDLKPEIKDIATDFSCLLNFLEIAEMYEKAGKRRY